jgi:signal transduction histidine kinase
LRTEISARSPSSQQGALRDTENKAQELLHLIEDLLEVARIEETSISLDLEPLDPASLVHEIMNDWTLRLQQERASTTIEVAPDVPPFPGDRSLLKRVFGNLIQNSLIHSSTAVELRIFARTDPRGVLFTVADNGPGIPPQYHEVIFHKFERVKTPNVPRVRSSGLGLAFCRLVVEAHGGRILGAERRGALGARSTSSCPFVRPRRRLHAPALEQARRRDDPAGQSSAAMGQP